MTGPAHTVTNVYEPTRDVLVSKENKTGDTIVSRFGYATNALGQRTSFEQTGTAFQQPLINLFGYDYLGQVTSANTFTGGTLAQPQDPAAGRQFGFGYDGIGNRTSAGDGITSSAYVANSLNQYIEINAAAPTYDADGNMLNDGVQAYQWDAENRSVKVLKGSLEVANSFDAQSRRVRKTVKTATVVTQDRSFLYDRWNPLTEYDMQTGTMVALNAWGLDLSGSIQGAGGVGGLLSREVGGNTSYYLFDGNGNVSDLVDSTGTAGAHYEYGPFGETLRATGVVVEANPFRFSSKYTDNETGLLYYGYRYYHASLGRWIARDPAEERGGLNLYAFVGNRALQGIDPFGLAELTSTASATDSYDAATLTGKVEFRGMLNHTYSVSEVERYSDGTSIHTIFYNRWRTDRAGWKITVRYECDGKHPQPKISSSDSSADKWMDVPNGSGLDIGIDDLLPMEHIVGVLADKVLPKLEFKDGSRIESHWAAQPVYENGGDIATGMLVSIGAEWIYEYTVGFWHWGKSLSEKWDSGGTAWIIRCPCRKREK